LAHGKRVTLLPHLVLTQLNEGATVPWPLGRLANGK